MELFLDGTLGNNWKFLRGDCDSYIDCSTICFSSSLGVLTDGKSCYCLTGSLKETGEQHGDKSIVGCFFGRAFDSTSLALEANFRVVKLWCTLALQGEIRQTNAVNELPPRDCFSKSVSLESLYGICAAFSWSLNTTLVKTNRDLLMWPVSELRLLLLEEDLLFNLWVKFADFAFREMVSYDYRERLTELNCISWIIYLNGVPSVEGDAYFEIAERVFLRKGLNIFGSYGCAVNAETCLIWALLDLKRGLEGFLASPNCSGS